MATVLFRGLTWRTLTLIAFETALLVGAVFLGAYLRLGSVAWDDLTMGGLLGKSLVISAVVQLCLYYNELYDMRLVRDHRELAVRTLQALGASSLVLGSMYFFFPDLVIGRGVFLIAAAFVMIGVTAWRLVFEFAARHIAPRERILLVGTNQAAIALARELLERSELGVRIVGFVDPDPAKVATPILNTGITGGIDDIPRIVHEQKVDRVVVSLVEARGKLPMERLLEMKLAGVRFDHLASVYEEYTGKIAVENLRPSWLIFSAGFEKSAVANSLKRAFDIALSFAMSLVLLPIMGLTALVVKLTSPGPAVYSQERVGADGRTFTIYKFRSMRQDAEAATGAVWSQKNDPRITPFGRIMRRTRLDELPQLWNVVRGDMSFVGPRPERPKFVAELTEQIPFYGLRHAVKPGLTGWAQVRYTYGASVEDALEKLQYDLFYIKHMSAAMDFYILFETIKTVVLRRGA